MPSKFETDDLRIADMQKLIPPEGLFRDCPITDAAAETTYFFRKAIQNILAGEDDRLMVVIGPCSIHDPESAREYGQRLAKIRKELEKDLLIVMRIYFEKPRTIVG